VATGKFLTVGGEKLYVRGVTYGTFRENGDGQPFPTREATIKDEGIELCSFADAHAFPSPERPGVRQ
jgi:hypothetical protein